MTVVEADRIEMADETASVADELFSAFERMPALEGYRIEIVEGDVFMTPQRTTHWEIILGIIEQLRTKYARPRVLSDVRIDYPGDEENAFCSDVALMAEDAERPKEGPLRCKEVEFVAEVISRGTGRNDYGPKKAAYAAAGVSVYLIVDPYQRKCHVYTRPKDRDYAIETVTLFGNDVDLTKTTLGLTIKTDEFPHD